RFPPGVSTVLALAFRSRLNRLDPRPVVLGEVELLDLLPCCDCLGARRSVFSRKEVSDEVDVAAVRDPVESRLLIQHNVLPDKIAVSRTLAARDLFFSPAVQAIPNPRLLPNIRRHPMGLFDDEIFRFAIARVVLNPELRTETTLNVLYAGPAQ